MRRGEYYRSHPNKRCNTRIGRCRRRCARGHRHVVSEATLLLLKLLRRRRTEARSLTLRRPNAMRMLRPCKTRVHGRARDGIERRRFNQRRLIIRQDRRRVFGA